jgi:diadenosine tetraphosphate (Ap4A) HIT family hydrolase
MKEPTSVQDEQALLGVLQGVAKALECALNQHTEVVVHNLRRPESSIVEIVNGHVSGRHVGSAIIAGPAEDKAFDTLVASKAAPTPTRCAWSPTTPPRPATGARCGRPRS